MLNSICHMTVQILYNHIFCLKTKILLKMRSYYGHYYYIWTLLHNVMAHQVIMSSQRRQRAVRRHCSLPFIFCIHNDTFGRGYN